MLGVSFMSGTMILTDTISRTFDNLFADVNRGTDAYVRSAQSLSSGFGGPVRRQRARVPASLVPEIESVPGAAAAQGNLQFYAQLVDKKGNTVGNPAQGVTGATDQFASVSVVAQPGVSQQTLKSRIAATLDNKTYQVLTGAQITKENQSDIRNAFQFFNVALIVFALVALFVATFIIFNTFSIVVAQRLREMALLRALGASGRQVMGSVLTEAVPVGLLASAVGLGAGIALSSALKALLDAFGLDIPAGGPVISAQTVLVALVVGTGVTIISAIVPARKASRVPPIAAMRDVATEDRPHS